MLEVEEGIRLECRNNRAMALWVDGKLRGVDCRAVGNEPGWNLEISAGGAMVPVRAEEFSKLSKLSGGKHEEW